MYLTQPTFMENYEIWIFDTFCKQKLFRIKMAITFAYGLEKKV
jgi:hypothetical protein